MRLPRWMFGDRQAKPPVPQALELKELGTTGTSVFGGWLRDTGEYNPDLQGLSGFATYEKMRRGDGQIAATLAAMKLPIRSAEWVIVEPEDATPVEKEATEFVREEFFEREIELDRVIENALLMLDFGCAAHEDVWEIDGGRVRLKKLAARLPVTFQRWIVDENEELVGVEQYGAKGNTYITALVPIEKLALFTFQQEGANFAGRSLLRPMYPHWYVKSKLYTIDAIACERNGMGVPVVTMGEGAKKEDREAALAWVQALCAHERTGLVLPPGWTFKLEGVTGALRDPKESIAHHNAMISMVALEMFMQLGQSESGNRALGSVMGDFFGLALHATAKAIARVINWTTITRLVDYNFEGMERYPEIVPQKILALRFQDVQAALKDLAGVELVQPDDELEGYLRRELGLPEAGKPRPLTRPAPAPQAGKFLGYSEDQEGDEQGKFGPGGGASGASGAKGGVKPAKEKAWAGEQVAISTAMERGEVGATGERVAAAVLGKDARTLNVKGNNFPADLVHDSEVVEVKTGLASNGTSAQQWRATIGQPGKAETAWLRTASAEDKRAWNERKAAAIMQRKAAALRQVQKQLGRPMKAVTVGVILNPDTKTADVFRFKGFHSRIGWNSAQAQKGYMGSYKYA